MSTEKVESWASGRDKAETQLAMELERVISPRVYLSLSPPSAISEYKGPNLYAKPPFCQGSYQPLQYARSALTLPGKDKVRPARVGGSRLSFFATWIKYASKDSNLCMGTLDGIGDTPLVSLG